ncbi:MAG: class I SAM-dependent methyltransferase [Flavobacteriales bacterium]|nr:class I SAM-dependent methyltransferase [Flavobacteriales bacterium]
MSGLFQSCIIPKFASKGTVSNPNAHLKEGFYSKLFARFYDPFMESMEQKVLSRYRKQLLQPLHGNILEVGSGTGINFKLYPTGCHVLASEPSEHMLKYAEERLKMETVDAEIELVLAGIGSEELESRVPTGGFDAIVCTLVLCTIPEPEMAVASFRKWLKPDGRLIILEHVHGQTKTRRTFHNALNPVWKHFAEGCHLNRDTAKMLKDQGFVAEWQHDFIKVLPFHVSVMKLAGK